MEHGACNVIYIDRRANDEHVRRESLSNSIAARTSTGSFLPNYFGLGKSPPHEVHSNVETLLSTFNEVHICASGASCLSKLSQLLESSPGSVPTIVLIDIPYDEEQRLKRLSREPRTPSPTSTRIARTDTIEPDDIYGMHLLLHVSSEIQSKNFSKLVVPVVVLSGLDREWASNALPSPSLHGSQVLTDTVRLVRYLDAGAVDVLSSPLSIDNVSGLAVHAYRVHKEVSREDTGFLTVKRNRKLSWVGVNDAKPYGYLREAMVSNLMSGICNPETFGESLDSTDLYISQDRRDVIAAAIGSWNFSAHDFTDDELLYGSLLMLKHALQMPELEHWGMPEDELIVFLLASRIAYNEFVLYHNFRHVTDVLQALFYFLVQIGTLPPYPLGSVHPPVTEKPPIAQLLKPFDALTLLISAIGHDVGHPGVNNAFLVALNAPLAQLYNDRSVLESFHCAAYSQILRRYWPKAFSDAAMRKLMINSILATDMGLHFKYMSELGNVQEKLAHDQNGIDGWSGKVRDEYKDLTCGLLIKCADISNVARKFNTAARWANILTDEFSNQGIMEQELQIPTCLFGGPPTRNDIIKLGESQIGFMNIFARPLFEAVADILPAMRFSVDEILINNATWEKKIREERENRKNPNLALGLLTPGYAADSTPSPLSGSPSKPHPDISQLEPERSIQSPSKTTNPDSLGRRGSSGSFPAIVSSSRRSSLGVDKGSRRSSGTGLPGTRSLTSQENQSQSRRGSGDASLTAILVTQTPNAPERPGKEANLGSGPRSSSPSHRKDTLTKSSPKMFTKAPVEGEKEGARPLTAPSSARRSQGKSPIAYNPSFYRSLRPEGVGPDFDSAANLFPMPHPPSQSHSEVDLSHAPNGNLDGSKLHQWESAKLSGDSNVSQSNASRETSRRSEWWRQMSSRRRTKDFRNGETNIHGQQKEMNLDQTISNTTSNATSPTSLSPGKSSRTGKLKNFFKRKPRNSDEQEKQLSSFGSSSQLRTPPTSDPGISVNSDD
ncbi:HD-domain/PDEase-like protein [Lindgomyces ingoldianus]|uniref:HD-domain/PDEase-like protein n=1 Tax=Lindgomyces ingoldianus TaxID=673940 RepID=A0ACB6RAS5_9PLEO|nr:HD-domain/PDEase-like protein [Lindgomyces ingoldianus]KAF2476246.1 HD-domain/PDEase-like protein [Lindgomyces ingoldianus]